MSILTGQKMSKLSYALLVRGSFTQQADENNVSDDDNKIQLTRLRKNSSLQSTTFDQIYSHVLIYIIKTIPVFDIVNKSTTPK